MTGGHPVPSRRTVRLIGMSEIHENHRIEMKTQKKTALIVSALVIGLTTVLPASPRGKHAVDFASNKHGAKSEEACKGTHFETSRIKRTGPPGKGIVRTSTR